MRLARLWLVDYRNYSSAELEPVGAGLTAVVGDNGDGKTNLLEAIAYLATLSSFRAAPTEALVRRGCSRAVIRGEVERDGRSLLLEVEVYSGGRHRMMVNRQALRRSRDLLGSLRVSVFSPDDLSLVKGAPQGRRRYLDDLLVALRPANHVLGADVERVLRQRNALLKQAGGHLSLDVASTLDVWDAKLAAAGEALVRGREELVAVLEAEVGKAYAQVAGADGAAATMAYRRSWEGSLESALGATRHEDLRRGTTTVGPHRDELELAVGALWAEGKVEQLPARTHASQGEQRSLALALRLAAHVLTTEVTGTPPVLLLDDVFSELDAARGAALLAHLPDGQAFLTTTGPVPAGMAPERTVRVRGGRLQ